VTQLQLGQYSVSLWDAKDERNCARTNDDDINDEFDVVKTLASSGNSTAAPCSGLDQGAAV
jgi:hypothetical protein